MASTRRIIFNFLLLLTVLGSVTFDKAHAYEVLFQDLPTNVLQRHIKVSRHQPFCVLFRDSGLGSKLEKLTYNLWQNKKDGNYTSWQFGSFDASKSRMPPNNALPHKLPTVRCYLGESSSYQYTGKTKKPMLKEWFIQLSGLYSEQSAEVSISRIRRAQRKHRILLLAFPDGPRHHEVEDMIYAIANEQESCQAMAIHLTSPEVTELRQIYGVNKYPSVVVIHNKVVNRTVKEDFQVFSGLDVNRHVLRVYIEAKRVVAPYLNMETFEKLLNGNGKASWRFKPLLLCFYAHWAKDVHGYLYAYNETVKQYRNDLVHMRYGLVDLVRDQSKKIVSRYLRSGAMKFVPFLVLFYRDDSNKLHHRVMHIGRPYAWTLYQPLVDLDIGIVESAGIEMYTEPWGVLPHDQYTSLREGPNGTMCTSWSHNMTDNTPYQRQLPVKKRRTLKVIKVNSTKAAKQDKTWHDTFDTGSLERKLSVHAGIPLVTMETWTEIIEKSHAPRHIFYKAGKWAGEITKVSLVVFIMSDCGNCRRNNQTFLNIQKAINHIDGGSMYYVNCTAEPLLCRQHSIRGFPTITAFRGLGWMDTSSCLTQISQNRFNKHVRMDYHGVIKGDQILDWFSRISGNAVIHKNQVETEKFQDKDVRLTAHVRPVTVDKTSDVWNYKCLRLMCERLYSLLDCYSIHQGQGTGADSEHLTMAIVKLSFQRRDGASLVLMEEGRSLQETLEHMEDSLVHRFHVPHNYNLSADVTCEDNIAGCTDVLTQFILDHSRLPVTPITSDIFHTQTSYLQDDTLPILIALAHKNNLTEGSAFSQALVSVAYQFYSEMTIMTLDVDQYSVWATRFVPHLYGHTRIFSENADPDDPDPLSLYIYPRLVIVRKSDHAHAAFYPPVTRRRQSTEELTGMVIMEFVAGYLEDPGSFIVQTEHF